MPQDAAVGGGVGPNEADGTQQHIEPSLLNALPHYLPLGIFPLIIVAAIYGGWWLLPAFVFMAVAGPLDSGAGSRRTQYGPGVDIGTPPVLAQSAGLDLGVSLAGNADLRHMANPCRGSAGALGRRAACDHPDHGSAGRIRGRSRAGSPAHRLGTAARGIPARLRLVSAIRHRACLCPPRQGRHALRRGVRSQGREFLEVFPQGSRKQPHQFLESRGRTPGTAPFADVALQQPVLALRHRRCVLVCTGVLDERWLGGAGLRLPRAVLRLLDEDQQLLSALRSAPGPPCERPLGKGAAATFLERRLEVQQLDVLQHAAPCGSSCGGIPPLSAAADCWRRRNRRSCREPTPI